MSQSEMERLEVIQRVVAKRLTQVATARQLGLSTRQVKRLVRRYREQGAAGLVSRHRGKRSGNAIEDSVRQAVMGVVHQPYADFGPTLACEKLVERQGYKLSHETLRQWMMDCGNPGSVDQHASINAALVWANRCRSTAPLTTGLRTQSQMHAHCLYR